MKNFYLYCFMCAIIIVIFSYYNSHFSNEFNLANIIETGSSMISKGSGSSKVMNV